MKKLFIFLLAFPALGQQSRQIGLGNVGIGPTAPSSLFGVDVQGDFTSSGGYTLKNGGAQVHSWYLADATTSRFEIGSGSGVFEWVNSNGTHLKIASDGSVGIGETNPTSALDIAGVYSQRQTAGGAILFSLTPGGTGGMVAINSAEIPALGTGGGSTQDVQFNTTFGTLQRNTSSKKYKENIEDIDVGLKTLNKFRPVKYNRKFNTLTEYGLIAEDVVKVTPNIISYLKGEVDGINYTQLHAISIKAIQELSAKLDKICKRYPRACED